MKKRMFAAAIAAAGLLFVASPSIADTSSAVNQASTAVGSQAAPNLSVGAPFPTATGNGPVLSPADAGYVLTPGAGISGFKYVASTFVLPSISSCSGANAALHFVGLGGWNGDNTLAAIGVGEGCSSGASTTYYYGYWYDTFFQHSIQDFVPNWFLAGGDTVFVSVLGNAGTGEYTFTLTDFTTGDTFTTTYTCGGSSGCASSSAEVFTATFQNTNSEPVPNFGTVTFTGAKVTPLGQTGTEGLNNTEWTTTKVIDYGTSTSDVVVQPGSITGDGSSSSFTNTWEHAS